MFDQKRLALTPANVRRLIEFNKLNNATLPDHITELATHKLVDLSPLLGTGLELDETETRVLQRIIDWNGRGLILDDGRSRSRKIALVNIKIHNTGPTLILCHPSNYSEWAELISKIWPSSTISVFGNPRYHSKRSKYPEGVTFSENPNTDADFLITSCASVHWHDLLGRVSPGNTVVEEFDNPAAFSYTVMDAIKGLFKELDRVVIIQDINLLKRTGDMDILTALQTIGSQATHQLISVISEYLWVGNNLPNLILGHSSNTGSKLASASIYSYSAPTGLSNQNSLAYLHRRGYSGIDTWKVLPVLGVSIELITDAVTQPIEFDDDVVVRAITSKSKKQTGFHRIIEREHDLEDHTGEDLIKLVQRASEGDATAEALIVGLRTTQWANAKAASIRKIMEHMGSRLSRTLIIAENAELVRALQLVLSWSAENKSSACENLASSPNPNATIARFLYPDNSCFGYVPSDKIDTRPLNSLIIRPSDLDNPDLLKLANFAILAEWPTDTATYQVIREEYVEPSGARLINTTLLGTIEEKIRQVLTGMS